MSSVSGLLLAAVGACVCLYAQFGITKSTFLAAPLSAQSIHTNVMILSRGNCDLFLKLIGPPEEVMPGGDWTDTLYYPLHVKVISKGNVLVDTNRETLVLAGYGPNEASYGIASIYAEKSNIELIITPGLSNGLQKIPSAQIILSQNSIAQKNAAILAPIFKVIGLFVILIGMAIFACFSTHSTRQPMQ